MQTGALERQGYGVRRGILGSSERIGEERMTFSSASGSVVSKGSNLEPPPAECTVTSKKASSARLARLVRTVEAEIVPRLLLSRRSVPPEPSPANPGQVDAGDAAELARLLLAYDVEVPFAYVEAIRYRGVSVQHIYLHLLAPAARRLGLLWERDECDFMQVTLGLGRLHQLLQRLSFLTPGPVDVDARGRGRRALLATAPGERHAFGILMVTQFFRQKGWEVWNEFPETGQELVACVRQHSFAVIGLSVATMASMASLPKTVRQLRKASINPAVCIMVGGPLLLEHPELVSRIGADATAVDAREAALRADSACALLAGGK
jgi:methanogenic corrinoid protein MtbC1